LSVVPFRLAVLDSSVVIKWFRAGEPLRAQALALQAAYLDGLLDLALPDLLIHEVANVLRYKPDLSVDEVCSAIQSLYDMDMALVTVTSDIAREAVRIARRYDVTVYDAVFLSCAQHISATLVSADEAFVRRILGHPSVTYLGDLPSPTTA
jgi:predicted nucleic acid-binding protein